MYGYGLFWEMPVYAAAAAAERIANSSEYQAQRANQGLKQLEARVEKLTMVAAAMWTLLKAQNPHLDDALLARAVEEIDLTDGRLDGRVRHDSRECPACHRPVAPRHDRCIYCGAEMQRLGAFGDVM